MAAGILTILCVAVFVVCAFMLRARMLQLCAVYETRMKVLQAAEAALECVDAPALEREIAAACRHSRVMRRHELLFRALWPHEYDRAFYTAQRFIAQSSRAIALSLR